MEHPLSFEPLAKPRFHVEFRHGAETVVIPAKRNWFTMIFLAVWLAGWSAGGVAAFSQALSGNDVGFLTIWLLFWFLGMVFALSWLGWQVSGREMLSVRNMGLVYRWEFLGMGREKNYELALVKNIAVGTTPFPYGMMQISVPPFFPMFFGSVKWNYGAKTIYAASGLTEAEGAMVVERLSAILPAANR